MNLFVLVAVVCQLSTGDCISYGTKVYDTKAECEHAAAYMRKHPTPDVLLIYCADTREPAKRVTRKARTKE